MNWPHIHLLLNHAPLFGAVFGTLLLALALWRRQELTHTALYVLVFSGFAAIVVFLTGEPAADALANAPEALVDRHEDLAGVATILTGLAAAAALLALLIPPRFGALARWMNGTVLALALGASALLAWTANLGGQINHPEIRRGAVTVSPAHPGEEAGQR